MSEQLVFEREALYVPDRFEGLRDAGSGTLRSIVIAVESALSALDDRFVEMRAARRGGLTILRGDTGAGKSTFLDTVGLFRRDVVTERISSGDDVPETLRSLEPTTTPRLVVLEGREALGEVSRAAIEADLHAINAFVRAANGQDTLVVWPTNTDDLTTLIRDVAESLGGEALLGVGDSVQRFFGPPNAEFVGIAERTVAALNQGASLYALGISEELARDLATRAVTIGEYLALVRDALLRNGARVRELLKTEQFRLWIIVAAGNDPEGDVAALTRGGYGLADIDRLMSSTGANIVKELKKHPEDIGILASVLDTRVIHLDMVTALAVAREYGDTALHDHMKAAGMSTSPDASAEGRLHGSELGLLLAGASLGTRKRGSKPGPGTKTAFAGLANIARTNDGLCNRALGRALQETALISSFDIEKPLGTDLSYISDLAVMRLGEPVRIEVMWRSTTGRADIANYVLTKLGNYGRGIGLLK